MQMLNIMNQRKQVISSLANIATKLNMIYNRYCSVRMTKTN